MEEGAPRRGVGPRATAAQVCAALNEAGARYLVIGGVACVLHGYVRATTDIDILIARTLDNAARVLRALATVGYGFAAEWSAAEILARPITVIGDDPAGLLLRHAKVALSPGLWFGPPGTGHARLNFATSPALLEQAVTQMARALPAAQAEASRQS